MAEAKRRKAQESTEAVMLTTRHRLLQEIETARMRHGWARAEVKRGEPLAALVKYLLESREELRLLKSLVRGK